MSIRCICLLAALVSMYAFSQPADEFAVVAPDPQEQAIRDRYEQVLERNPFQESAFDRVYDGYMLADGVDAWLKKLEAPEGEAAPASHLVLRGRIFARQLRRREAIEALAAAREQGEAGAELDRLLGQLYYEEGRDEQAIALLTGALDAIENPDERAKVCRILGNVYLRSGKREEAAAAWQRIIETSPGDFFALQELAEIYEANRLWDEAVSTYEAIVAQAADDPYRRCQAYRAIGRARAAQEHYGEAIAAFEAGLELAAPGNWVFEDLKDRLVSVYESMGDLDGLAAYVEARLAGNPTDLEFRELLAETHRRRGDMEAAEQVLNDLLARAPDYAGAYELLIRIYNEAGRTGDLARIYETLIARHPDDPDYLRRLGEAYLTAGAPEKAMETWNRAAGDGAGATEIALLAEWLERYEFYPEAAEAYRRALSLQPDREWQLRLAGLQFDLGKEAEALAAWQDAVAPEDTPAEEIAEIAALIAGRGFKSEALALYGRAMAQAPDNLDYVLAAARLHVASEDHQGALPLFNRLADQEENEYFKNSGEQGLLDAYAALGTLDAQRAAWEQEIAEHPDETGPRLKLARLYARAGNRPGAVALYEACAGIDPENTEIQRRLAEAYRLNRQYDRAIEVLERLMEADPPRSAGYLRELLPLYARGNDQDQAIAAAERLVEMTPSSAEARKELAEAYQRYGKQDEALQQYRNLVQIDSTEATYYRDFGDALSRANRLGEASDIFRKMLEVAGEGAVRLDAVNRLAGVYVRTGQLDTLVNEFEGRVRATPKNLPAYDELAAVYRTAGNRPAAMEALERARDEVEDHEAFLRLILAEAYDNGDFGKVVSTYEELLAMSGEPTIYELDRLAQAHARTGNMDQAQAVWDRIASENRDDGRAQLLVARALQEQGFIEEATPYVRRALEIDPYDYTLRLQYAQDLLNRNEPEAAEEQLALILEIGEPPAPGVGSTPPSQAPAPSRHPGWSRYNPSVYGQQFYMNQQGFGGGLGGFYQPYRTTRFANTGGFEMVRAQVLSTMVQIAQQGDAVADLLAEYRKKTEEDPDNIDARSQYLSLCISAGESDLALTAALDLHRIYPDDPDLLWQVLELQQGADKIDDAIQTARKLSASTNSDTAVRAYLTLVQLYGAQENEDAAGEALATLAENYGDDANVCIRIAAALTQTGREADAVAYYDKAIEIEPRLRPQVNQMLAMYYRNQGNVDQARVLLTEILFAEPDPVPPGAVNPAAFNTALPQRIHVPQYDQRFRSRGGPGNQLRLQGFNYRGMDYQKQQALSQILQMTLDDDTLQPILAALREKALAYGTAETPEAAEYASQYLILFLTTQQRSEGTEAALATVEPLAAQRPDDLLLQNLTLNFLEDLGRYEDMEVLYAQLETQTAASPTDLAQARLHLALARGDYEAVPDRYRAFAGLGGNTRYLSTVVQALDQSGAFAQSTQLLEEDLAKARRPETLILLSRARTRENDHDAAIDLAREAWQMQSGASGRSGFHPGNYQYDRNSLSLMDLGLQPLFPLWDACEKAGRGEQLIAEFKERLAGQPNSPTLHLALAGLYCQSKRYDVARDELARLAELRPNDLRAQIQYAEVLEANGDKEAALGVLESLAQARPGGRRAFAMEMQRLYRELNKTEALASLQDRMVQDARTPSQMQELAQNFANAQDFGRAAEMLERVQRLQPENVWASLQVADFYWRDGQKDKALEKYTAYFTGDVDPSGAFSHGRNLLEIIERYKEEGQLDALKSVADGPSTQKNAITLATLGAQIALFEKRYDDAKERLEAALGGAYDSQLYGLLAITAEKKGDIDGAIAYLEKAMADQGNINFRRLAELYLKKGNTEQAVLMWKKSAEQQGGPHGHLDAVSNLLQAEAYDAAGAYFAEVIDKLPAADWGYQQLCETIIRQYVDNHRFEDLVQDKIFTAENANTGPLAEQLTRDFYQNPKQALARLEPIASRFPENVAVQARKAEILERTGDIEAASVTLEAIPRAVNEDYGIFERRVRLLGKVGQTEKQKDLVNERLALSQNPESRLVQLAAGAYMASGDLAGLDAVQARTLEAANPSQRPRLEADFAKATGRGDPRAAIRAVYEANPNDRTLREYVSYLESHGFHREASAFYDEITAQQGTVLLSLSSAGELAKSLIASGRPAAAWKIVLEASRREENPYDIGNRVRELSKMMADFGASTDGLRSLLDDLKARDTLTLNERYFAAAAEAYMGHGEAALGLLKVDINDYHLREAIQAIVREAPPEQRGSLMPGEPGDPATDRSRLEMALDAARQKVGEKKSQEAIALLDTLEFTADLSFYRIQRARLYADAGAIDKAIADCRAELEQQPDNVQVGMVLALMLARAGKYDEAVSAWRESGAHQPDSDSTRLAAILVDHDRYSEAREVLEEYRTQRPGDVEADMLMVRLLYETGLETFIVKEMESSYEMLDDNQRDRFDDAYGDFLQRMTLWPKLLADAADSENDALAGALLDVAQRAEDPGANATRSSIAAALAGRPWTRLSQAVAYAELLRRLERRDEAAEVLRTWIAASPRTSEEVRRVSDVFRNMDRWADAAGVLVEFAKKFPDLMRDGESVIDVVARAGDAPEASRLFDTLQAAAYPETAKQYNLALLALKRKETAAALDRFRSLLDAPEMEERWLLRMQDLFRSNDAPDDALRALDRLRTSGAYSADTAAMAAARMIAVYLDRGDHAEAIRLYAEMLPARRSYVVEARAAILGKAETIPLEDASAQLMQLAEADLSHARVPDLLALRAGLAKAQGAALPSGSDGLAGLSPEQAYRVTLWTNLIDTWLISPLETCTSWSDMAAPLPDSEAAWLRGDPSGTANLSGWKLTTPAQVYPAVALPDPGNRSQRASGKAAYAAVLIESPDERAITLAHGSDDWSRVWVNGEEVFSNAYSRACVIDQDRILAMLRAGANRVLVKCGNKSDEWEFTLAIVEGSEGLSVHAPIPDQVATSEKVTGATE